MRANLHVILALTVFLHSIVGGAVPTETPKNAKPVPKASRFAKVERPIAIPMKSDSIPAFAPAAKHSVSFMALTDSDKHGKTRTRVYLLDDERLSMVYPSVGPINLSPPWIYPNDGIPATALAVIGSQHKGYWQQFYAIREGKETAVYYRRFSKNGRIPAFRRIRGKPWPSFDD